MIKKEDVCTCTRQTPVAEVAQLMLKKKIGCVVVVEDGKAVGIITKTDLLREAYERGNPAALAHDVMSSNLLTIDVNAVRDEAADLLHKSFVHHLVVVRKDQGNAFAGLTSTWDVVREAALDAKAFPYSRSYLKSIGW